MASGYNAYQPTHNRDFIMAKKRKLYREVPGQPLQEEIEAGQEEEVGMKDMLVAVILVVIVVIVAFFSPNF